MAQTDLKADDFCGYNQAAKSLLWTLQKPNQQGYNNTFSIGTVGVAPNSNFVRPDLIDVDSFLSSRGDLLSRCNPPIVSLEDATEPPLTYQDQGNTQTLQPIYTKEKKSAVNLSAVSYLPLTLNPDLPSEPQNLNHIIFAGAAQRGGVNTSNLIKSSWNSDNCETFLDPSRACGRSCSEVNGYMTRLPLTQDNPEATWGKLPKGLPSQRWYAPGSTGTQIGKANPMPITSQMVLSQGIDSSLPQMVVPTQRASPHDPRNRTMSFNKIPTRKGAYQAPPIVNNPLSGGHYPSSPFEALVGQ